MNKNAGHFRNQLSRHDNPITYLAAGHIIMAYLLHVCVYRVLLYTAH